MDGAESTVNMGILLSDRILRSNMDGEVSMFLFQSPGWQISSRCLEEGKIWALNELNKGDNLTDRRYLRAADITVYSLASCLGRLTGS